jgi:hypothetical protein
VKTSSIIAGIAFILAVAAVAILLNRLDRLEDRVQRAETALATLDPLRRVLAQARPPVDAYRPVQATGAPNVPPESKDSASSWCPGVEDGGNEWLLLGYPRAIAAEAVEVHANYNPGAVVSVAAVADDGTETEVWSGPAQPEGAQKITRLSFTQPISVKRLKLTVATGAVPGWNEIDAVALVTVTGERHWATQATASSTWQAAPAAR